MASREAQEAIECISTLSKASSVLSPHKTWEVGLACEVGKEVLRRVARQLIEDAEGAPVLSSKSCDGTPLVVAHRGSSTLTSGKKVRTQGRECCEFLVKNQFLRTKDSDGKWKTAVLLGEPVNLIFGKSVNAIIQASLKDWDRVRDLGHMGCAIEHYVFDRAGITALERNMRQWHQRHARIFAREPVDRIPELLELSEFVVITPCAMHDAHNAFRWGFWQR